MSSPGPMQQQHQQNYPNPYAPNYNDPVPSRVGVLNISYLKTVFFIIKLALVLLLIGGAISVSVRYDSWSASRYYNFAAVTGIVVAVLTTLIHLFRVAEKLDRVPWNFIEMVYDVLWAVLFLIAAAILTDYARKYQEMDSYAAGAFFGYAAMLLYLIDATFRFIAWRRGALITKNVPQPVATNTPPPNISNN